MLPRGELAEPLAHLIQFLLRLVRRLALHRLILVAHPVGFELEEIREILGGRATAAPTASAATTHLHLHLAVRRLGALHPLQGTLFRRQRVVCTAEPQRLLSSLHVECRGIELGLDHREGGVHTGHIPLGDALGQGLHLLLQASLHDGQGREVLAALALAGPGAVAHPVEGAGHDFTLTRREPVHRALTATTAAPTTLLGLAVVAPERPDLQEVDVAGGGVAAAVGGHRVVGNQVAGLQGHLLEEEGVRGPEVHGGAADVLRQSQSLFLTAVDTVPELDLRDAVIVISANRDGDLLEEVRLGIPSRLVNAHHRRQVLERLDRVVDGARNHRSVRGHQIHPVVPVPLQAERRGDAAVLHHLQRRGSAIIEAELASGHRHRHHGAHDHVGADHRRQVTTILDDLRRQAGVSRKLQLQSHLLHGGQVGDRDLEGG